MTEASRSDARVSLKKCRLWPPRCTLPSDGPQVGGSRQETRALAVHIVHTDTAPPGSWELFDDVNTRDVFLKRVPMLKSCPFLERTSSRMVWIRTSGEIEGETRGQRCWRIASLECSFCCQ